MHWGSLCQDHLGHFGERAVVGLSHSKKQALTEKQKPAKLRFTNTFDVNVFGRPQRGTHAKQVIFLDRLILSGVLQSDRFCFSSGDHGKHIGSGHR